MVDATIDAIRDSVVKGERVTLADFGTFERKHRNQRIARNPRKPDVPIVVPARDLPSFTPGKEFRAQVVRLGRALARLGERHEAQTAGDRAAVVFGDLERHALTDPEHPDRVGLDRAPRRSRSRLDRR